MVQFFHEIDHDLKLIIVTSLERTKFDFKLLNKTVTLEDLLKHDIS
jgi:hypothetical protein